MTKFIVEYLSGDGLEEGDIRKVLKVLGLSALFRIHSYTLKRLLS